MRQGWAAIDFETANSWRGSACAVGMTIVENEEIVDRFSTYIQPPGAEGFASFNIGLHGINAKTVQNAPRWEEALNQIMQFADGRILVAHNAGFDISVIREACTEVGLSCPKLKYVCTLVIARRVWRLLSYKLPFVVDALGLPAFRHHDAQEDADAAARIAMWAIRERKVISLDELLTSLRIQIGEQSAGIFPNSGVQEGRLREKIPHANVNADSKGLLYKLRACFTGTLITMTRSEAQRLLAEEGGQPVSGVGKKTDLLVVGMPDSSRFAPGMAMSHKQRDAQNLLDAGYDIEVIDEIEFLKRLGSPFGVKA